MRVEAKRVKKREKRVGQEGKGIGGKRDSERRQMRKRRKRWREGNDWGLVWFDFMAIQLL